MAVDAITANHLAALRDDTIATAAREKIDGPSAPDDRCAPTNTTPTGGERGERGAGVPVLLQLRTQ